MLEPVVVETNGNRYTVTPFSPQRAHAYLHDLILARATGRGLAALGKVALGQCISPEGVGLDKGTEFEKWFATHPRDMLELEALATDALVSPWESAGTHEERVNSLIQDLLREVDEVSTLDDLVVKIRDEHARLSAERAAPPAVRETAMQNEATSTRIVATLKA